MFNWVRKRIQENQKQFNNNKNREDSGDFISGPAFTGLNDDDKHTNDGFSSGSSFDSGDSDGGGD